MDEGREDLDTKTTKTYVVAYFCTGHGLGHATRVCQVCDELLRLGLARVGEGDPVSIQVVVISSLPEHFFLSAFEEHPRKDLFTYRKREPLDCGGIQEDAFVVKPQLTLETYRSLAGTEERRRKVIAEEVQWLLAN